MYIGLVSLDGTLKGAVVTRDGSNTPINPTTGPTYRVYGDTGVMNNGTGTLSFKDSAAITGATNASPIVITSAGHKLSTGTRVTITGVGGNTAANSTFQITVIDSNTFSLDGSTGNGAYTSGGTWNVSGLYGISLSVAAADGYDRGKNYAILVTATVSGTVKSDVFSFTVV